MKKNILIVGVAAAVGLATFTLLPAQEISIPIRFVRGANTVTGAPYSAEAVTETTRVLADGNRLERSSSVKLYRDSLGRERSEQGPGAAIQAGVILISDPVSQTSFRLDPAAHTAQKSPNLTLNAGYAGPRTFPPLQTIYSGELVINGGTTGGLPQPEPVTEQLASKTLEGMFVTGERRTVTIPAGQIGNQKPIQDVDEMWYSPELKLNILYRHSDPRGPEAVYRLTNISRGEPDPSLFQVPPDYKITVMGGRGRGGVAP